jgi:hypothetical protein
MQKPKQNGPKFPGVTVYLTGGDGNAFAVLGAGISAMREAGVPPKQVAKYVKESMSGDYDNLLATAIKWVDVR